MSHDMQNVGGENKVVEVESDGENWVTPDYLRIDLATAQSRLDSGNSSDVGCGSGCG